MNFGEILNNAVQIRTDLRRFVSDITSIDYSNMWFTTQQEGLPAIDMNQFTFNAHFDLTFVDDANVSSATLNRIKDAAIQYIYQKFGDSATFNTFDVKSVPNPSARFPTGTFYYLEVKYVVRLKMTIEPDILSRMKSLNDMKNQLHQQMENVLTTCIKYEHKYISKTDFEFYWEQINRQLDGIILEVLYGQY